MRNVKIIKVPFLIPTWAIAQVVWPNTIWWNKKFALSLTLIAHELVHIEQQRRYGILKYWFLYLVGMIRYGYWDHPFEVEAHQVADMYIVEADKLLSKYRSL